MLRFKAALHETRCRECRVTWISWLQRIVGDHHGMTPKPRSKHRETSIPFREWPWRARLIEKLYRATHGGQIRTLVVRDTASCENRNP